MRQHIWEAMQAKDTMEEMEPRIAALRRARLDSTTYRSMDDEAWRFGYG